MGLKLIHISKRGNWWSNPLDITLDVLTINCLCKTFPDFAIKVLCFLTKINLTFKFQLMVHEKLSWRNCKCPVDLWQPGQIVLKKFHPSKNPALITTFKLALHNGQLVVRCPHGYRHFCLLMIFSGFPTLSLTWADIQRLGVAATTTDWGDMGAIFAAATGWIQGSCKSFKRRSMWTVWKCAVSKTFPAAYADTAKTFQALPDRKSIFYNFFQF